MSLKTLNRMVHKILKDVGKPRAVHTAMKEQTTVNKLSILKENKLNFNEIKKMAKGMQINTNRLKLPDVIHSIQRAENNIECYGTQRVDVCNEEKCLWRSSCVVTQTSL
jgi:hypothetical protein